MDTKRCGICGHQWALRAGSTGPVRCPNPKCRSKRWDKESVAPVAPPAQTAKKETVKPDTVKAKSFKLGTGDKPTDAERKLMGDCVERLEVGRDPWLLRRLIMTRELIPNELRVVVGMDWPLEKMTEDEYATFIRWEDLTMEHKGAA